MSQFRAHIRKARAILHKRMSVPAYAFYVPPTLVAEQLVSGGGSFPDISGWIPPETPSQNQFFAGCTVRVHEKWMQQGDLKGTNFHYAEHEEVSPKLIIWASEWSQFIEARMPFRNLIISIEEGLAFEVDSTQPADDQTITLNANRIEPRKAADLPYPGKLP